MWGDNPASAYAVLCLGNMGGGMAKGVTGFGSAIINLCCWIIFNCSGVASGTLQQAVVTEALASTFIAPGLLYVTRAHQHADFKIVSAIALFVTLSSPIGAAILAKLDVRRVELVMACALLVIILVEHVGNCVKHLLHKRRAARRADPGEGQKEGQLQEPLLQGSGNDDGGGSGFNADDGKHGWQGPCEANRGAEQVGEGGDCVVVVMGAPSEASLSAAGEDGGARNGAGSSSSSASISAAWVQQGNGSALGGAATSAADGDGGLAADTDSAPLIEAVPGEAGNGAAAGTRAADGPAVSVDDGAAATGRWCCCTPSAGFKAAMRMLAIGSIAGTLSGIMEGLTGMNGPPIMIMYRALDTPKAVVRGNNAFLNLLQFRLVPYWMMGLITPQDLQLYVASCAAGVVGIIIGDQLSKLMSQQVFQKVLGFLMVLCCILMFASGLGVVG